MKQPLPKFEKVVADHDSSFKVQELDQDTVCPNTRWHFHPEYELTYISNGVGKRQVGTHLSTFTDGELILLGAYVPHFSFSMGKPQMYQEITVQISPEFIHSQLFELPELRCIKYLIESAKFGISFGKSTKQKVEVLLRKLVKADGFTRIPLVLEILNVLAVSQESTLLNARVLNLNSNSQNIEKVSTLFQYIEKNYQKKIELSSIARELAFSETYTCRFIKQTTLKNLTQIANEFRVAKACELLVNTNSPISEICYAVGFNNLSNFNKQVKVVTESSSRECREEFWKGEIQ